MEELTEKQAVFLSAYTGTFFIEDFGKIHKFIEETLDRPVLTHEMADQGLWDEVKEELEPQLEEITP